MRGSNTAAMPMAGRGPYVSRALAYRVRDDGFVEIYDLDFAAYCLVKRVEIADMKEEGPKPKNGPPRFLFLFKDEAGVIPGLSVAFTNSECAQFADCIRRLKKAIRSTYPREG